jgi:uncharacterized cupredoxin-like copper-binding protein
MVRQLGFGLLVLGIVALGACSGRQASASKPAGEVQNLTIKGTDQMRFEPATLTVRANVPVTISLDDSGTALDHDLTIDNIGGQKVSVKAQPHGKATGQFTPTAAGTYEFYCAEPGHKEAGMVGTLTVS